MADRIKIVATNLIQIKQPRTLVNVATIPANKFMVKLIQ